MWEGPVVSGFQPLPGAPNSAHPRTVSGFLAWPDVIDPPHADGLQPDPEPPAGLVPRSVFVVATVGRLWLSLVTGMLLIATLPGVLLPGWSAHVVMSGSMEPKINVGDVVLSQDRGDYQPGQVIVFDSPTRGVVTHRIQSVDGSGYATRGDANQSRDSEVTSPQDVLGLGRVLVMFAGLPWVWYHTSQWLFLALFLLSLVLGSWAVARDRPDAGDPRQTMSGPGHSEDAAPSAPAPAADHQQIPHKTMTSTSVDALQEDGGAPDGALSDPPTAGMDAGDASTLDEAYLPDQGADPEEARRAPEASSPSTAPGGARSRRRRARTLLPPAAALVVIVTLGVNTMPPTSAAFTATSSIAANTWTAAASFATYAATIVADGPYLYLRLNEAQPGNVATLPAANLGSLSTSQLYTRASTGTFAASFGLGASASANMTPTPNSSAQILKDGVCILPAAAQASLASPQTFTVEAWIKSTGAEGGKIVGFENQRVSTTLASQYDRHLYQDTTGYVYFGIWTGSATTVKSPTPLNDNAWHHVMGTLTGANGTMSLYVDGTLAGSLPGITAQTTTGWWRFGCGNLSGWTTSPAWSGTAPAGLTVNHSFIGFLDEPAVYLKALTATDASRHYNLGKP